MANQQQAVIDDPDTISPASSKPGVVNSPAPIMRGPVVTPPDFQPAGIAPSGPPAYQVPDPMMKAQPVLPSSAPTPTTPAFDLAPNYSSPAPVQKGFYAEDLQNIGAREAWAPQIEQEMQQDRWQGQADYRNQGMAIWEEGLSLRKQEEADRQKREKDKADSEAKATQILQDAKDRGIRTYKAPDGSEQVLTENGKPVYQPITEKDAAVQQFDDKGNLIDGQGNQFTGTPGAAVKVVRDSSGAYSAVDPDRNVKPEPFTDDSGTPWLVKKNQFSDYQYIDPAKAIDDPKMQQLAAKVLWSAASSKAEGARDQAKTLLDQSSQGVDPENQLRGVDPENQLRALLPSFKTAQAAVAAGPPKDKPPMSVLGVSLGGGGIDPDALQSYNEAKEQLSMLAPHIQNLQNYIDLKGQAQALKDGGANGFLQSYLQKKKQVGSQPDLTGGRPAQTTAQTQPNSAPAVASGLATSPSSTLGPDQEAASEIQSVTKAFPDPNASPTPPQPSSKPTVWNQTLGAIASSYRQGQSDLSFETDHKSADRAAMLEKQFQAGGSQSDSSGNTWLSQPFKFVGGLASDWKHVAAGAASGAGVGLLGGPFAEVSSPTGAQIGGRVALGVDEGLKAKAETTMETYNRLRQQGMSPEDAFKRSELTGDLSGAGAFVVNAFLPGGKGIGQGVKYAASKLATGAATFAGANAVTTGLTTAAQREAGVQFKPGEQTQQILDSARQGAEMGGVMEGLHAGVAHLDQRAIAQDVDKNGASSKFVQRTVAQFTALDNSKLPPDKIAQAKNAILQPLSPSLRPVVADHVNNIVEAANQISASNQAAVAHLPPENPNLANLSDQQLASRANVVPHPSDPVQVGPQDVQAEIQRRAAVRDALAKNQPVVDAIVDKATNRSEMTRTAGQTPDGQALLDGVQRFNASSGANADLGTAHLASDLSPKTDPDALIQSHALGYLGVAHSVEQIANPDDREFATTALKILNGREINSTAEKNLVGSEGSGKNSVELPKHFGESGMPLARKTDDGKLVLTDEGLNKLRQLVPASREMLSHDGMPVTSQHLQEKGLTQPKASNASAKSKKAVQPVSKAKGDGKSVLPKVQGEASEGAASQNAKPRRVSHLSGLPDDLLQKRLDNLQSNHERLKETVDAAKEKGINVPKGTSDLLAHHDRIIAEHEQEIAARQAQRKGPPQDEGWTEGSKASKLTMEDAERNQMANETHPAKAAEGDKPGDTIKYHGPDGQIHEGEVASVHPDHYRVFSDAEQPQRVPFPHVLPKEENVETKAQEPASPAISENKPAGEKAVESGNAPEQKPESKGSEAVEHVPGIPRDVAKAHPEAANLLAQTVKKMSGLLEAVGIEPADAFAHFSAPKGTIGLAVHPGDAGHIQLDLTRLASNLEKLDTPEERRARVEAVIEEEAVHLAAEKVLGTKSEATHAKIWQSLTDKQKKAVTTFYGDRLSADDVSDSIRGKEAIRMMVQLERSGRISEIAETGIAQNPEIRSLFQKVVDYLKSVLKPNDEATKQLIARINNILDQKPEEVTGRELSKSELLQNKQTQAKSRLQKIIERGLKRRDQDNEVHQLFDEAEEKGETPRKALKDFVDHYYDSLPTQAKERVDKQIETNTGLKVGDVLYFDPKTGEKEYLKKVTDGIDLKNFPDKWEDLESTDRNILGYAMAIRKGLDDLKQAEKEAAPKKTTFRQLLEKRLGDWKPDPALEGKSDKVLEGMKMAAQAKIKKAGDYPKPEDQKQFNHLQDELYYRNQARQLESLKNDPFAAGAEIRRFEGLDPEREGFEEDRGVWLDPKAKDQTPMVRRNLDNIAGEIRRSEYPNQRLKIQSEREGVMLRSNATEHPDTISVNPNSPNLASDLSRYPDHLHAAISEEYWHNLHGLVAREIGISPTSMMDQIYGEMSPQARAETALHYAGGVMSSAIPKIRDGTADLQTRYDIASEYARKLSQSLFDTATSEEVMHPTRKVLPSLQTREILEGKTDSYPMLKELLERSKNIDDKYRKGIPNEKASDTLHGDQNQPGGDEPTSPAIQANKFQAWKSELAEPPRDSNAEGGLAQSRANEEGGVGGAKINDRARSNLDKSNSVQARSNPTDGGTVEGNRGPSRENSGGVRGAVPNEPGPVRQVPEEEPRGEATVVGPVFGKTRIKFADGTTKLVENDKIEGEDKAVHASEIKDRNKPLSETATPEQRDLSREALGHSISDKVPEDLKNALSLLKEAGDSLKKTWAPQTRGEEAAFTGRSLSAHIAEMDASRNQAHHALQEASAYFDRRSEAENLPALLALDEGTQTGNPDIDKFNQAMREMNAQRRDALRQMPNSHFKAFLVNYLPHIFVPEDVKAAQAFFEGKIEGSRSFLKHRTIPSLREALEWEKPDGGKLRLVSYNPVDLYQTRWGQMDKYMAGQKMLKDMIDSGIAHKFEKESEIPAGNKQIDDRIGLSTEPLEPDQEAYSRSKEKLNQPTYKNVHYYAPESAVQILENHLSEGLRDKSWYKVLNGLANTLNQAQLGLSAFHLGFTTLDMGVSKLAYGLEEATRGNYGASAKAIASVPLQAVSPFHLLAGYLNPKWDSHTGAKLYKEMDMPGSQGSEIAALAHMVIQGGGSNKMDPMYSNMMVKSFMKAMRQGNYFGAAIRALPAGFEATAKPILEYVVPRQKLAVFADLATMEMNRLGPNAGKDEVRAAMQKAWASVDNRMGQLRYNNLYWNKTGKDLAMLGMRSVGWNIGSVREIGGGLADSLKLAKKLATGKAESENFTHRIAYVLALHLLVGGVGGLINFLATGQPPQDLRDYFFPKTGQKNGSGHNIRLALPSYVKDEAGFAHQPGPTFVNKANPLLSMVFQLWNNKDFFGTEIRHGKDSESMKALEDAEYVGKQFVPFGVTNAQRLRQQGASTSNQFLPEIGITPAAAWIDKTDAERKADEIMENNHQQGGETQTQFDHEQKHSQLMQQLAANDPMRGGDSAKFGQILKQAVQDKTIRPGEIGQTVKHMRMPALERQFQEITDFSQAEEVWDATTPEEKKRLLPMMKRKIQLAKEKGETIDNSLQLSH